MLERFPLFIAAFICAIILGFLLLPVLRKIKASQTILHYVKEHAAKQGTPTMGGIIFLLASAGVLFAWGAGQNAIVAFSIAFGYGVVGFLDDFIKIYFKRNLGLKAYQKIIFQLAVALIASLYVYLNKLTVFTIPFSNAEIDFGIWSIPLVIVALIATTNCVNLTDGLDGLATSTGIVSLLAFGALILLKANSADLSGYIFVSNELMGLVNMCISVSGALLAFLAFNIFPAKVFMGDTGALSIGGFIAMSAILSGYTLFIPIIGLMFVVSGISVIAQVFTFKVFKKRIILMAPYHHHLQQKKMHENRITLIYFIITMLASLLVLYFTVF